MINFYYSGKTHFSIGSNNTTYCAGARPPQYILDEHSKKRILKGVTIVFKKRDNNSQSEVTTITNNTGQFKIKLPPGIWQYFITEDISKNNEEIENLLSEDCDKLFNMSFGEIIVEKDSSNLEILFHLPCNPCDSVIYPRM